jgi:acyl carrier protein
MTPQQVEEQLRTYIADTFLTSESASELSSHADLLRLLDSLQLLRTVIHLEAAFSMKVEDSELTADNLGSLDRMATFVARKTGLQTEWSRAACHVEP